MAIEQVCSRCGEDIIGCYVVLTNGKMRHQHGCRRHPFKARRRAEARAQLLAVREAERDLGLPYWEFGT